MHAQTFHRHAWINALQSLLLVLVLVGICALAGMLLLGRDGLWMALAACAAVLVFQPTAATRMTLTLYRAQPIAPQAAPWLWQLQHALAERAGLPAVPTLHYVPSPMINAFAVGNRRRAAIAVTDGLLRGLTPRELAGVLAHETAHIASGDLRVMGLADYVSRLTSLLALAGQIFLLLSLPGLLTGSLEVSWSGLLLLIAAPHIALLAQLGLSRVREFDADLQAAALTGDPMGLASALARIERAQRSWLNVLLPGWGNPEPSWLRTHPATAERIRRLQSLAAGHPQTQTALAHGFAAPFSGLPDGDAHAPFPADRHRPPRHTRPRWRAGGLWH